MDKSILRKFAIESRKLLMISVENQLKKYHVDEEFSKVPSGDLVILKNDKYTLPPMTKEDSILRDKLKSRINRITKEQVIEEAAYTWFNRIIAIRYMELHDMLPLTKDFQSLNIRVLSSKDGVHPEILKMNNITNSALDINVNLREYMKYSTENEQFNYVLKKVCNKLGKIIPQIFDGYTDYIDVLLPDNLLLNSGFIYKLIDEVPEECFDTVEVIGWLYQYYNEEEKAKVMASNSRRKKEEVPLITQIFTPDWIVKYMVENSLGRYWIERNYSDLKVLSKNWKYFINEDIEKIDEKVKPTDITFIDPCSGSGHILVYAFEIFIQIYKLAGYNIKDIPELILKNNLYGLDIDDRAGQLSVLSVLLKAREYDQNIFNKDIVKNLNVISLQESKGIDTSYFDQDLITNANIDYLVDTFKDAKEIGSLLKVEKRDYSYALENLESNILDLNLLEQIKPLIKQANLLSNKYTIMVTNPPYLNSNKMNLLLKSYIKKYYDKSKTDLSTAFVESNMSLCANYSGIITRESWLTLGSYNNFRKMIIEELNIVNAIHLGSNAFEEIGGKVLSTIVFILSKFNKSKSLFISLDNIADAKMKEKFFLDRNYNLYRFDLHKFLEIRDYPIIYNASDKLFNLLKNSKTLSDNELPKAGLQTGNNELYTRFWYEVSKTKFNTNENNKWVPFNKVGMSKSEKSRKWYGNRMFVVNWENDGFEIKNNISSVTRNSNYYFKESISCNALSTKNAFRYYPTGGIFDVNFRSMFLNDNYLYILALFNSSIIRKISEILTSNMALNVSDIKKFPMVYSHESYISNLSMECIRLAKEDWDSFETSWEFTKHPLLKPMSKDSTIRDSQNNWNNYTYEQRSQLKYNEEEINRLFIEIYGLQDELKSEVEDKDITLRNIDKIRDIKSFISYFVGCLFGRYSLDEDGLIFAGGQFDSSKYKTFKVDEDNIVPIMDTEYFKDDIVAKFKKFVKITFNEQTLDENLDYIADILGRKGNETSEQVLRRYFVNNFYKDHIRTYKNKPIYWLLDSGKKTGFKALIYMHRYNKDLISRVRLDYIGKVQTIYENRLKEIETDLNSNSNLSVYDVKQLEKEQNTLYEKLEEVKKYYVKLSTIGDKKIEIDLDNGVTENYKLFRYKDPETNEETNILGEDKTIVPKKK